MTEEYNIDQSCQHTTCDYWGQGGCMLPGRCIYAPTDEEIYDYMSTIELGI
jgi:hypothetical protein